MKRKFFLLLFLVVLLALIGGIIKVAGGRQPREGELRVESSPTTSIFLENKHMGRTPLRQKTEVGEYTLRLVPESTTQVSGWQGKITVGPNLLTYINATLAESELSSAVDILWLEKITSKKAEFSVITNPDGATVVVDDQTRGVTPLTIQDLEVGEHTLAVTSPGFLSRTVKVKLTAGYKLIANLKLALSSGGLPEATPTATAVSPTPTPKTGAGKTATPSATFPDPPKPFVIIKDTPTGFLRVRMEPTTAATEAAQVKPGEKYTYLDNKKDSKGTTWYQIKYDGQNSGWVSGQYVETID